MPRKQYGKGNFITFNELPNELIIELFGYLNGIDTVYAFSHLNTRLQSLLFNYVKIFDFKSISKAKFDYVTQHHHVNQWRSLRLSDDDETPGQIRLFSQLYPPHQYLSQLQSLSVLNMTPRYAQEFLSNINSFGRHLVSLKISNICGEHIPSLTLPSLKRLILTGCKHNEWMMNCSLLESLEYTITDDCHYDHDLTLPTTLKHLKLFYDEKKDGKKLRASLQQLCQLTKLALYAKSNFSGLPNGATWEELIQLSMPLLKIFQFCFPFQSYANRSDLIEQVIKSFSTPFYLIEKQWFIRCDYDWEYSGNGTVYSLPFAFKEMPVSSASFGTSMSRLVDNNMNITKYQSYSKVNTLLFINTCEMSYQGFITSNIVRLVLAATPHKSWHSLFPNLRYLEFKGSYQMSSASFVHLLARTPAFQSLTASIEVLKRLTDKFTNNTVCHLLSQQIRSLTLSYKTSKGGNLVCVTEQELRALVSVFGQTCEHLNLAVAAPPKTIIPILQKMQALHSLRIHYCPRYHTSQSTATYWIQEMRKMVGVFNMIHAENDYNFYIWFGNRS